MITDKDKMLYSRKEASAALALSVSSIDQLILSARLRVRRIGSRVLIPKSEIEKLARSDIGRIFPPQINGKSTRHFAPAKPAPANAISKSA
jgi:excisionase family DNA binding protein